MIALSAGSGSSRRSRRDRLSSLRVPPPRYQLDGLLLPDSDPKTGKARAGFETLDQALAEDWGRVLRLRIIASALGSSWKWGPSAPSIAELSRLNLDAWAASDLADRLAVGVESGFPEATLASAPYMRDARLRTCGAVLQLADASPWLPKVFTAIHPSWAYPADRLMSVDARQVRNQFRTHLNRAGVISAEGFLAACLHGEFEPFSQQYQLHFHGICAGDKLQALDALHNKQGYIRTAEINRPLVIGRIGDPVRQISYLMQAFWPKKARVPMADGTYQRTRTKTRIREPYQSLYLLWLDQWSVDDMWLLNGIRIKGGRMVLS